MKTFKPIDWAVLERLAEGRQTVDELHEAGPRATLYRRVAALRAEGLIAKASRGGYALTAPGERMLAERHATVFTEGLITAYPPLAEVPAPQYRALLELAFAARALRQHTDQDDRHAAFLILGPTLRWKTSAAEFLAVALGVDPANHITDLRTESGQSLWIRRGAKGQIVTERQLLEAPLAVFDEYRAGDRAVRRAVAPFLAGRRRVAIENTVARLGPVAVVILNPGPGSTLSARTGLSEPQLRRLIPLDVTNLAMPDLALVGMRAVAAARLAGAAEIPAPRAPCEDLREPLIELLRAVLTPEGLEMMDVDMMLGLGRGMTAWFPATAALRQTLYNALLVVETVGWVTPGWVDAVRTLPHGKPRRPTPPAAAASTQRRENKRDGRHISLFPERREAPEEDHSMTTHQSMLPTFSLSDDSKAGLVWLSRELRTSLDNAVRALLDHYEVMVGSPDQFGDLQTILNLRDACDEADIAVSDLRESVELNAGLREYDLSLGQVRDAVEVGKALDAAGLTLQQVGHVLKVIAALDEAGIDAKVPDNLSAAVKRFDALGFDVQRITTLADLSSRLEALGVRPEQLAEHHDHLEHVRALGLDSAGATALARALDAAGIAEKDRGVILRHAVSAGCSEADRLRLQHECAQLESKTAELTSAIAAQQQSLVGINDHIVMAQNELNALRKKQRDLAEECEKIGDAIVAASVLERFLIQHTTLDDPLWTKFEALLQIKRKTPALFSIWQDWITPDLRAGVRGFLEQIARGGDRARPGTVA